MTARKAAFAAYNAALRDRIEPHVFVSPWSGVHQSYCTAVSDFAFDHYYLCRTATVRCHACGAPVQPAEQACSYCLTVPELQLR